MADTIKKVLLQKQIEATLYDIFPKTAADIVTYTKADGSVTTVAAELAGIATTADNAMTETKVDEKIKALRDEIYGLAEGENLPEAFDTLKEISKYLNDHGSVVQGFTDDISALKTALGAPTDGTTVATGLFARVEALETALGTAAVKSGNSITTAGTGVLGRLDQNEVDIAKLQAVGSTKVEKSETNGSIKIDGTDTQVYDETALAARVKTLEDVGSTKVEDGDNDGEIKVDGTTVTVYGGDPTVIKQDETHRFVTDDQVAAWDADKIVYGTAAPAEPKANVLYLTEIS